MWRSVPPQSSSGNQFCKLIKVMYNLEVSVTIKELLGDNTCTSNYLKKLDLSLEERNFVDIIL